MKILLVLCRPLVPADSGGKIRTMNTFGRLARRMAVHVVSLADRSVGDESAREMEKVFASYTPVYWSEPRNFTLPFYWAFAKSRLGRFPYFLDKYRVTGFRRAVEELCSRETFDLLVCDGLPAAVAIDGCRVGPRVLFERNVEFVIRKQHFERERRPLFRWLLRSEWEKAYAVESEVCRNSAYVIAVSEDDRQVFEQEFGLRHVAAIPTGVDTEFFKPRQTPQRRGSLVFVGALDWFPNEDGICWFVREVYPLIRRVAPHATLTIVGRKPSPGISSLAAKDPSLEVTGTVPDVRPFLDRAEVVVVPLRIGSGTRIKIFEAMAMGRAVVSTTLGAAGLPVGNGREILLADTPEAFASATLSLLEDGKKREEMERMARAKVEQEHSWDRVAERMETLLRQVTLQLGSLAGAEAAKKDAVADAAAKRWQSG